MRVQVTLMFDTAADRRRASDSRDAHTRAGKNRERARLWKDIQTQLADDAVNAWIWNPAQVAVYRKGLQGLWSSSPIFANDMTSVRWAGKA